MDCFSFQCLLGKEDVYYPPVDLVEMFLILADKYNMAFYFGMYDSGKYWQEGLFQKEIDLNMALIDEVWKNMVIINLSKVGIYHKKSAVVQKHV